jgi:hypothetical protein
MFCQGSTQNGVYTMGGIQRKTVRRPRIRTMPSQKEGVARPAIEKIRTA